VKIVVTGATNAAAANAIARVIANSPLVKCAMHGNDPNWGRIVSAAGYAGVPFDPDQATLKLQGVTVFRAGQPVSFDAEKNQRVIETPRSAGRVNVRNRQSHRDRLDLRFVEGLCDDQCGLSHVIRILTEGVPPQPKDLVSNG